MKRVLYTQTMAKVARDTMQDLFTFEAIDKDDANAVLAAVAPAIATKALRDYADYLEETGTQVGLEPATVRALGNITRRYADGLPTLFTATDRLVEQMERLRDGLVDGGRINLDDVDDLLELARKLQEEQE